MTGPPLLTHVTQGPVCGWEHAKLHSGRVDLDPPTHLSHLQTLRPHSPAKRPGPHPAFRVNEEKEAVWGPPANHLKSKMSPYTFIPDTFKSSTKDQPIKAPEKNTHDHLGV